MKINILTFIVFIGMTFQVSAQTTDDTKPKRNIYTTSSGEMIFSLANMTFEGADLDPILRWSPVFNFQNLVHFDKGNGMGFFTGFNFHNVGFIYDVPNSNQRKKVRNYNIGIPVGVKVGNSDGMFIYGGYELEIPINYKEKTFENDDKVKKFNTWFSKRTNAFNSALFIGVQLTHGANIKFKYYLTNFYKKSYTEKDSNGNNVQPYKDFDVNIFYFSLTFDLFRNDEFVLMKDF